MSDVTAKPATAPARFDAIVVGAGFAGMYALTKLRSLGFSVRVIEAGSGVGGTWYWNRYPGARCDGESLFYSYSFSEELQQEWTWSERYAAQPEILAYANHVADRFDLGRDIAFDTRVTAATFDDAAGEWLIETASATGGNGSLTGRFLVMASGCLSTANAPRIAGIDSFKGQIHHTGHWPHREIDFSGQRVAVIGTGSSGIQAIPIIARQARHLTVFQRTANYAIPAWNKPLDPEVVRQTKANYPALRETQRWTFTHNLFEVSTTPAMSVTAEEREAEFERRWQTGGLNFMASFSDLLYEEAANEAAADFIRRKIRSIVKDPKIAALLSPKDVFGCKRLCVDTGYFDTYNRDNVSLVDISGSPIEAIAPEGVVVGGKLTPVDAIVMATGFDAMTGALLAIDIRTSRGASLRDTWKHGPTCYLGLMVAGFPNLFTITGPGSPSVFTNMIPTIEHHVDWVAEAMAHLRSSGRGLIEADAGAEADWVVHVREVADVSLRPNCNSWYVGANVPGKPRVFMPYMGGMPAYRKKCSEVVARGYEGFRLA